MPLRALQHIVRVSAMEHSSGLLLRDWFTKLKLSLAHGHPGSAGRPSNTAALAKPEANAQVWEGEELNSLVDSSFRKCQGFGPVAAMRPFRLAAFQSFFSAAAFGRGTVHAFCVVEDRPGELCRRDRKRKLIMQKR